MRYFINRKNNDLIQFNPETKVYKLRNTIQTTDKRISVEDFKKLDTIEIKLEEFSRLMNIYFKDIKHEWYFEGKKYRKLPNFESDDFNLSTNYKLGKDVPYHTVNGRPTNYILVYHWGNVYYHTVSYNGEDRGQLIDARTHKIVRWAQMKHCSPIKNIDLKIIC